MPLKKLIPVVALMAALTSPSGAKPSAYDTQRKSGDAALRKKNYPAAIAAFTKLTKAFPKRWEGFQALGFALYQSGQVEPALLQFNRALRLAPKNASIQRDIVLAVDRQATLKAEALAFPEALELLGSTEKRFHGNQQALVLHFRRGEIEFFSGDTTAGLALWKDVARQMPQSGTARFLGGYQAHQQGQLDIAEAGYKAAVSTKPTDPVFLNYYGLLLSDQGKLDESAAQFQAASATNPPYTGLYIDWARLLQRQGRLEAAAQQVQRLAAFPRLASTAHLWLAALARSQNQTDVFNRELGQAALSQTDSVLVVSTTQPGWEVWIDQTYLGPSPVGARVTPGFHRIKVQPTGRQPSLREVDIGAGKLCQATADQLIELQQSPLPAHP